jgi:hypothetical protein
MVSKYLIRGIIAEDKDEQALWNDRLSHPKYGLVMKVYNCGFYPYVYYNTAASPSYKNYGKKEYRTYNPGGRCHGKNGRHLNQM